MHELNDPPHHRMDPVQFANFIFPDKYTGETLVQSLREARVSWGLWEEHQVFVTIDKSTNNNQTPELNIWLKQGQACLHNSSTGINISQPEC